MSSNKKSPLPQQTTAKGFFFRQISKYFHALRYALCFNASGYSRCKQDTSEKGPFPLVNQLIFFTQLIDDIHKPVHLLRWRHAGHLTA